jgi:hypothetical protein
LKPPRPALPRLAAQQSGLRVFRVPILLGLLSVIGLLSALLGDAAWDALSWLALGIPCAVIAWFWFAQRR